MTTTDTVYPTKTRFRRLFEPRSSIRAVGKQWHEIVYAAYELQFDKSTMSELDETAKDASRKLWQCITLLGHPRVSYETIIEGAWHLAIFKKVNIVANDAGVLEGVAHQLSHSLPPIASVYFKRLKGAPADSVQYQIGTALLRTCRGAAADAARASSKEKLQRGEGV